MWSFSFELSFSHTLRNKKSERQLRNTLKQFFNWPFGPHVLILKLLINASGLIVNKLCCTPPKSVKNTKRTILLIIVYISHYRYTQFSKEFHMAFKFLVLKIVVSNTPSKIFILQVVEEIFCYLCVWISQTVCFLHNFYYLRSANYTLLGTMPPSKIKIAKELGKHFLLLITKTLFQIYKETIKNYDINGSLRINFSGPQIIFLWDTPIEII